MDHANLQNADLLVLVSKIIILHFSWVSCTGALLTLPHCGQMLWYKLSAASCVRQGEEWSKGHCVCTDAHIVFDLYWHTHSSVQLESVCLVKQSSQQSVCVGGWAACMAGVWVCVQGKICVCFWLVLVTRELQSKLGLPPTFIAFLHYNNLKNFACQI